jgi:hypothetical protein
VPALQTVSATFSFTHGTPVTVTTSTTVNALTGVVGTMVSPNYLPPVMVGGPANQKTLQFLFTNHNSGAVTVNSRSVAINPSIGATFTPSVNPAEDNCTGAVLNNGASCQLLGTFEAPTVVTNTPLTVTATVNFTGAQTGSANASTSTTLVQSITTTRVITLVNQCSFPVWFSLNGGALADSPTCTSDAQCPTGTVCNTGSKLCYWINYPPDDGIYELDAVGGGHSSNTVNIPLTNADPATQWSGNISASTLCDGTTSCGQADCNSQGGSASCSPGVGFKPPATQAEITMLISNADSYDVEVINGFHIPVKMEPELVTPNNYNCGVPGNEVAGNGFGACTWSNVTSTIPSNAYYWVTSGGSPCGSSYPACAGGTLCGLNSALDQVCGDFLGYWTSDQACAVNSAKASPYFLCNQNLSTPFPNNLYTLQQLMACSVPKGSTSPRFNSCYLSYTGYSANEIAQCCGCVDWWTDGVAANPNTDTCTRPGQSSPQTDPEWTNNIKPQIKWLKQNCPSVYTYPFDDPTSGFSCSNNTPGSSNTVDYTITFCAGGLSGLPPGINDGR